MTQTEVELKLAVAPEHLERLRRHRLIQSYKQGRPSTRMLRNVYFDTPELNLHRSGVSLRVRHVGTRRIQTVKTASEDAAVMARQEWEDELPSDQPEPRLMLDSDLREVFAEPGLSQSLRPVFSTEMRRSTYRLAGGDWEVLLAVEQGAVRAGDRSTPICGLEMELVRGSRAQLYRLAQEFAQAAPLRLITSSKPDQGYALLDGGAPLAHTAKPVTLTPGMSLAQAFQVAARAAFNHMILNEPALVERQAPEAVHQMRVAVRRLRAVISIFRKMLDNAETEAIRDELRWLMGLLGPARDTDVFLAETLAPVREAYPHERGLNEVEALFRRRRIQSYEHVLQGLRSPRFTRMMLSLGAWIEDGDWLRGGGEKAALRASTLDRHARAVLSQRLARVRRAGKRFQSLDEEKRHALRLLIKKFRYATDFFKSLYPEKKARAYLKRLTAMQDYLGALNDVAVARALTTNLAPEDPDLREDVRWAAGAIAGWHGLRAQGLLKTAGKTWKSFTNATPFWDAEEARA